MKQADAGPRRVDPHAQGRLKPATLAAYRRAITPFLDWLTSNRFNPASAAQYDDLLVEWKRGAGPVKELL